VPLEKSESKPLAGDAARVGEHYDKYIESEAARLEQFSSVEYAITLRYLARYLPEKATVAEVGVGTGHYSEFLARRGCRVHLVDVSERLLEAARKRVQDAWLASSLASVHRASGSALPFEAASLDAVLLLGPLYHLREVEERKKVVQEARRVLRPRGIVAAAGINRLSFLRDMFRQPDAFTAKFFGAEFAEAGRSFRKELGAGGFIARYLATGNLDPQHAPPIGYAHLTTVGEFRELLTANFEELAMAGTESFTAPWQDLVRSMPAEEAAAWLDIVEATGKTIEGMACADHFLFIGRRKE
jgi:ubiquinone/menaquinone biosynthesis C-methylase UbiE